MSRHPALACAVALALLLAAASPAAAFRIFSRTLPEPQGEVTVHFLERDLSAAPASVDVLRDAMARWNAVACSRLRFVEGAPVAAPEDAANGVIFFAADAAEFERWCGSEGAVVGCARALLPRFRIALRGELRSSAAVDPRLLQVAVHELGHAAGLDHAGRGSAVMVGGAVTHADVMSEDDMRGVCFLHPLPERGAECSSELDCPLITQFGTSAEPTTCREGRCVSGAAGWAGECARDEHCRSGACLQSGPFVAGGVDWTQYAGICTEPCGASADCPEGAVCKDGRCLPGHACVEDADCRSELDLCVPDGSREERHRCARVCADDAECRGASCEPAVRGFRACGVAPPGGAGGGCRSAPGGDLVAWALLALWAARPPRRG